MKWLIGVDLARSSAGAIRFAQWTRDTYQDGVVGLHAMQVPVAATEQWTEAISKRIRSMTGDFIASLGVPEDLPVDIERESDPERALADACASASCDAVVIGRRARTDQASLIRLGAVARRMVRHASAPLVVCPPELDMEAHSGPVVVAIDGTEPSDRAAVTWARSLAKAWQRPWCACHVAAYVDNYASAYFLNSTLLEEAQASLRESGQRLLDAWQAQLDEAPDEAVVLQGAREAELLRFVRERRACTLVVGSRRQSVAQRLFSTSAGMVLAAHADCPVAIVPPREDSR